MSIEIDSRNHIVGFDLGHGETALARAMVDGTDAPKMLEVQGEKSWPTVYAKDNSLSVVGKAAIRPNAEYAELYIGFKSRPDRYNEAGRRLAEYAGIVLEKLEN